MEEAEPQSQLPSEDQGAVSERTPADQMVEEDQKHDDRTGNSDSGTNLELCRQMFAGVSSMDRSILFELHFWQGGVSSGQLAVKNTWW